MTSNTQKHLLVLQQPTLTSPIRTVSISDVRLLQHSLWQDQDIESIEDFIRRIKKFEEQKRGIGIVVLDEEQTSKPIIAYGQISQWVRCAEISDLIVDEAYRSRGIGTAMIQFLTRYALDHHITCVELGVARRNPRALALYRRLGFQDSYTLQLDLGEGTEPVLYLRIDLTPYL